MLKQRLISFFLALLCAAPICLASAETEIHAFVGYDGTAISGRWYPLFVEITADEEPVRGTLSTQIRTGTDGYDELQLPVSVNSGETKQFRLSIRPQASQRTYDLTLENETGETHRVSAAAQHVSDEDALVIGVLGGDEQLVQALSRLQRRDVHGEIEQIDAVALSADRFAETGREMDAFDALVAVSGCDASLSDTQKALLEAWQSRGGVLVQEESADGATAENVLAQIEAAQESGAGLARENANYRYSESLNAAMPVRNGGNLYSVSMLLVLYTGAAGFGAYVLMKRLDRSKDLWLLIPALAITACALMALLGRLSGMNQPMSASVHVTHYKEDGSASSQELALLTYAGQQRTTVSTGNGLPLERMEYGYFYNYAKESDELILRDRITLGQQAAIELKGGANWLKRSLVVFNPAEPQGSIEAKAYMQADGLHVTVLNQTDTAIEDAVILTEVGYAQLGELKAGEQAQALLARTDESPLDENGNPIIRESCLLPFTASLYQTTSAAADPGKAGNEGFSRSWLPEQEQLQRRLRQRVLELGAHNTQQDFSCVLVGRTPEIVCEALIVNGKPVTRSAQESVLICEIPFEPIAPDGHVYYPQGTFKRYEAAMDESGAPVRSEEMTSSYAHAQQEVLAGFALSRMEAVSIEEIRLYASGALDEDVTLEAYDWTTNSWTTLEHGQLIALDEALVRRVVNAKGELFVRYTGEGIADRGVYLHSIIVEGTRQQAAKAQATKEGGVANDSL